LQVLWAGACEMGDAGADALAAGLPDARALSLLHLDHSSIGSSGASALSVALQSWRPTCRLTVLSLVGNEMSVESRALLLTTATAIAGLDVRFDHSDDEDY
jgi:hypothetical protein